MFCNAGVDGSGKQVGIHGATESMPRRAAAEHWPGAAGLCLRVAGTLPLLTRCKEEACTI